MAAEASEGDDATRQHQRDQPDPQQQKLEQFRRRTHDMYEAVADKPLSVVAVRIEPRTAQGELAEGLRTRQDILDRELQRVYDAKSLREVHVALEIAVDHLRQLEVFRRIDALIDDEPADVPDACSVQMEVQERGWYSGGVQTFMQGNEGHVQGTAALRNVLGAADQWKLTGECGHRSSFDFAALFRLPRAGGTSWSPDISVFRRSTNLEIYSSFVDTMRGLELGLSSADGSTRLSYLWGWRSLVAAEGASRAVRSQRGDFLSDALRWSWVLDERDSPTVHTEGWGARLAYELGGLYPGARHIYAKQRVDWVWAAALNDTLALNVSLGAGLIHGLAGGSARRSSRGGTASDAGDQQQQRRQQQQQHTAACIADRFFLGGCDSVRGFAYHGLGPSVERPPRAAGTGGGADDGEGPGGAAPARDALGADVFASVYAGLVARLPGALGDVGGCAHAFVNGGSGSLLSDAAAAPGPTGPAAAAVDAPPSALGALGGAARRRAEQLAGTFRWSAGVGLVLPTPMGRFEANYVWVLSSQQGDIPKAGMQFGFAASPINPTGPM